MNRGKIARGGGLEERSGWSILGRESERVNPTRVQ